MAVIETVALWEGTGFSWSEDGIRKTQRVWKFVTDNKNDDADDILAALPIQQYDPHPLYPSLIARELNVDRQGPTVWLVTVPYSNEPFPARGGDMPQQLSAVSGSQTKPDSTTNTTATPAPQRNPEFSFTKKDNYVVAEFDKYGNGIVNTVGDKITGIEINKALLQIDIKYWTLNLTVAHITAFWDTINNATWKGFPAKSLKVDNFNYRATYDTIAPNVFGMVHEVTVTLLYNRDKWNPTKILNAGMKERKNSKIISVVNEDGHAVSEPVPLKQDGSRWTTGAYHYVNVDFYEEQNFDNLLI